MSAPTLEFLERIVLTELEDGSFVASLSVLGASGTGHDQAEAFRNLTLDITDQLAALSEDAREAFVAANTVVREGPATCSI